jgi:hypothetical protein
MQGPQAKIDVEELRAWLAELIKSFREEMEKMPAEVKAAASRAYGNFSPPCQMMVVWAKELEFQIILIAHLEELEDEMIEIHGPMENSSLLGYMEAQVLNSDFIKMIGREKVEWFLAGALRSVRSHYDPLKGPPKPAIPSKAVISLERPYAAGWLVVGSLLSFDAEDVAKECVKEMMSVARAPPSVAAPEGEATLEGFGAYMYPPVWIGGPPKPLSFRERVLEPPIWEYSTQIAIRGTYKGLPFIMLRDGYIAVGSKERAQALEFLNEIAAALFFLGVPVHVIREADVGEAIFKEKRATWGPDRLRAWQYYLPFHVFSYLSARQIAIDEEKVRKAIRLAERITANKKVRTLISLFHEAYTYFMNTEYKQALIMGWVILEDFYVDDLLSSALSKMTPDEERLKSLKRLMGWSIDKKLKALNILQAISGEEYASLMEVKKARNEVVHEGKMPKREVVEKCLELVSRVVGGYVKEHL